MRASLVLCLIASLASAGRAHADEWSDGLHAELERGDLEAALKSYAKVSRGSSSRAAAATRRQILLLGAKGDTKQALRRLSFLRTFPRQKLGPELELLERDPAAFVRARQAASKGRPAGKALFTRADVARAPELYLKLWRSVTVKFDSRVAPKRERRYLAKRPWLRSLSFLSKVGRINVVFLGKLHKPFDCQVEATPFREVLRAFCRTQGTGLRLAAKALIVGPSKRLAALPDFPSQATSARDRAVQRTIDGRTVSFSFSETPVGEALDFFQDITGLSVVRTGKPRGIVTTRIRDMPLREAMRFIAYSAGIQVRVAHGAVVAGQDLSCFPGPAPAKAHVALNPEAGRLLASKRVTVSFSGVRLDRALGFLEKVTGLKMSLGPGVKATTTVSLRLRNPLLGDLLHLMLRPLGLQFRITRAGLRVEQQPEK